MKAELQRACIAEFCRWTNGPGINHPGIENWARLSGWHPSIHPFPRESHATPIPDYPNDLNAMHEAWKCLPNELRLKFTETLFAIVVRDGGLIGIADASEAIQGLIENATAPQRAEALLRTIGKWKD